MSEDASMWGYWRREYGSAISALTEQFPETLAKDPVLQQAAAQIRVAEMAIESRMQELEDQFDE